MATTQSMFLPYNFEASKANALKNAGGDPNSKLYTDWLARYGSPGGSNPGLPNSALASNVNQFMTGQAILPFLQNLPGYAGMVGQRSQNALSMLKGQIPDDVISQISQGAAERGIMGGTPQSPNANAAYLRSLGLTSLDMQNQGSELLSKSIADTPVPQLWNPMSLYVPQTLAADEAKYAQQGITAGKAAAKPDPKEYSYATVDSFGRPSYQYKYFM